MQKQSLMQTRRNFLTRGLAASAAIPLVASPLVAANPFEGMIPVWLTGRDWHMMGKALRDRLMFGHHGPVNLDIALYWSKPEDFTHILVWRLIEARIAAAQKRMIDAICSGEPGGLASFVVEPPEKRGKDV